MGVTGIETGGWTSVRRESADVENTTNGSSGAGMVDRSVRCVAGRRSTGVASSSCRRVHGDHHMWLSLYGDAAPIGHRSIGLGSSEIGAGTHLIRYWRIG